MSKKYLITFNDEEANTIKTIVSKMNETTKKDGMPIKISETAFVKYLALRGMEGAWPAGQASSK